MWDNFLLSKAIREVPGNYSSRFPLPKVEDALRGSIYDSYIRRILFEGVFDSWSNDTSNWLTCATPTSPTPETMSMDRALTSPGLWNSALGFVHGSIQTIISMVNPKMGVEIIPDGPILCPYYWAQPIHQLNCDIVWPVEVDDTRFDTNFAPNDCNMLDDGSDDLNSDLLPFLSQEANGDLIQLDSPEYSGVIAKQMILEKLLAQGGIRLAGILNYIFAPKYDDRQGLFIIDIDD